MNEFNRDDIINLMQQLKLNGMTESYDEVISDSIKRKLLYHMFCVNC